MLSAHNAKRLGLDQIKTRMFYFVIVLLFILDYAQVWSIPVTKPNRHSTMKSILLGYFGFVI